MSQLLHIHPDNPQPRLLNLAVDVIRKDGVLVYPTDSTYALGCHPGNKAGLERIRQLRQLDERHNLTLICRDLSELATYAVVDNRMFRLLKAATPGPYTFLLKASSEVPRRLAHPKRKTIGLRLPQHTVTQALLEALDAPLLSTTLLLPGDAWPLNDAEEIQARIGKQVDLILDGGACGLEPTTVVDLASEDAPLLIRRGKGALRPLGLD